MSGLSLYFASNSRLEKQYDLGDRAFRFIAPGEVHDQQSCSCRLLTVSHLGIR